MVEPSALGMLLLGDGLLAFDGSLGAIGGCGLTYASIESIGTFLLRVLSSIGGRAGM